MTLLSKLSTPVLPTAALALFCFGHQAGADAKIWNNNGTDFNTAGNWTAPGVPGSSDHIVFDSLSTGTNPNLSSSATIQQILFTTATSSGWTLSSSSASQSLTLTSAGTGNTAGTGAAIYASNTSGTNTISTNLIFGAAPVSNQRFDMVGGTLVISGQISGTINTFVKGGNGILSLTGDNTYTATTSISNGVLLAASNASFGNSANAVTLAGGTLRFGSAFDISTRTINITGASRIDTNGFDVTLANSIGNNGGGSFRKDGAGTLTLSANNTYTGGTNLNGGVLEIANDGALGSGTMNFVGSATVRGSGDRVMANALKLTDGISTIGSGGDLTFGAMLVSGADNRLVVSNAVTTVSSIGQDTAGRNFTKQGTGALVVTGNSDFTGTTKIDAGTFAVRGDFNDAGNLTLNGGVIALNGVYSRSLGVDGGKVQWLTGRSGGFAAIGTNAAWGDAANNLSVNIGGNGSPSTLTFGGTNFLTSGQALILGSSVSNGTVTLQNGLDLASAGQTVEVNRSAIAGAGVDAVIAGVISNGSLTKTGSGILSLGAAGSPVSQSYAGPTVVSAGTLLINGSVGSGGIAVSSGATLGGNFTAGGTTTIASGATLAVGNSAGSASFASLTLAGTTEIEFEAGADPAGRGVSFDGIDITDDGGFTYGGTLNLVFAGAILSEQTFDLFDLAGTPDGSFSSIALFAGTANIGSLTNDDGIWTGTFDLAYGSGAQTFTFTEATGDLSVIPEPSTWALIGLGLAFTLLRAGTRERFSLRA